MSTPPDLQSRWNYRIISSRQIVLKAKNEDVKKLSAIDLLTKLPFALFATDFPLETIDVEKVYFATFKIYTLNDVTDVPSDFVEFFTVLDVDQGVEDFIKAYWLYPSYIKFELAELEQM